MSDNKRFWAECMSYIDQIMYPGIPYISTSHVVLSRLYEIYGTQRTANFIDSFFSKHSARL